MLMPPFGGINQAPGRTLWKKRCHRLWCQDAIEYTYKTHKPVILVVNKVDNPEMRNDILLCCVRI